MLNKNNSIKNIRGDRENDYRKSDTEIPQRVGTYAGRNGYKSGSDYAGCQ